MQYPPSHWIEKLKLEQHPEGGYFREVYRSPEVFELDQLPERYPGDRNVLTCAYFLLEQGSFSAFHRIESDELWHYHFGDPLTIYVLNTATHSLEELHLGPDLDKGHQLTVAVPHGTWFASRVDGNGVYTLASCSVAPGFDFEDFYLAERDMLLAVFPEHETLIRELTRE